ncbi:cytosine deaminase [Chlamydia trachomatis]|nr:cytosine deaminase [Chlamydia trachomatis]
MPISLLFSTKIYLMMSELSIVPFSDQYFMKLALQEAQLAYEAEEVPIGAVIVSRDTVIGRGHNLTETLQDVTAHAEMIALTAAQNYLGCKVLPDCTLYVTVEPCVMCAGAIRHSRLKRVVWGADEPKSGNTRFSDDILHPSTLVTRGILAEECASLMQDFFRHRR